MRATLAFHGVTKNAPHAKHLFAMILSRMESDQFEHFEVNCSTIC